MAQCVTVLALGSADEAQAIRLCLEHLGLDTVLRRPGSPQAAKAELHRARDIGQLLVISAHGSDRGFYLGSYGDGVDVAMMDGDWLPARALTDGADLTGMTVISTACTSAGAAFAAAFLGCGAATYIAPQEWPEGNAILPALNAALYRRLICGDSWLVALDRAAFVTGPACRLACHV